MKGHLPSTPALRLLRQAGVPFDVYPYRYEPRGGTRASARELGVHEHLVVKTLVLRADGGEGLLLLMHGDRQVSLKALARALAVRVVEPSGENEARRLTGYQFGGTSPFGTRRPLPVYAEQTIRDLPRLFINGGARGLLVALEPAVLESLLPVTWVSVAVGREA
jgi:Cys-tRNA(Pro) deacylase